MAVSEIESPTVIVEVASKLPSAASPDSDSLDDARPMGIMRMPCGLLQSITKLGIDLEREGVVRFADGMAAFTATHAAFVIQKLTEKLEGEVTQEELHDISRSLSALARSMGILTKTIKQSGQMASKPIAPRMSFPANSKVTFVNHQTVVTK
jgi:hypothetical protein